MVNNIKKICFIVHGFSGGGAERVMVTLANKFHQMGHNIDFIVSIDAGPYREMLHPRIRKIVLTTPSANRLSTRAAILKGLFDYFINNPEAVVMSTIRSMNNWVTFSKLIAFGQAKLFLREAAVLAKDDFCGFRKKILLTLMRFFYPKSDGIIANSQGTRNSLVKVCKLPPERISVIYNPLELSEVRKACNDVIKSTLPNVKVIAVGRLVAVKNFKDLIAAFPEISNRYLNATLEIYGEGPEKHNLQSQISELGLQNKVFLKGFSKNIYKHFAEAHVFVQTSLREGFGYVLAEAMACGTPVVACDGRGAMREILDNGKYGILVKPGDHEGLVSAILKQIDEPTPKSLLQEAVLRFDADVIARKYLTVLGLN